jgi:hypothetical protein
MERLIKFNGLKKGDKIQVISKNMSYGIALNRIITLSNDYNSVSLSLTDSWFEERFQGSVYPSDCIIVESSSLNITTTSELDKMRDNLKKLEEDYISKKESLEAKIKFCEDNNLTKFDDKLFKVYKAIDAVQSGGSKLDQAKAILEVVNMK